MNTTVPIVLYITPHKDGKHCGKCKWLTCGISGMADYCEIYNKELTKRERHQSCLDAEKEYKELVYD